MNCHNKSNYSSRVVDEIDHNNKNKTEFNSTNNRSDSIENKTTESNEIDRKVDVKIIKNLIYENI